MYINMLKRKWIHPEVINFMNNLPNGFVPYIRISGDKTRHDFFSSKYNERFVENIGIYFMDIYTYCWFDINNVMNDYDLSLFHAKVDTFIENNKYKTKQPDSNILNKMAVDMKNETINKLSIDNDITPHLDNILTINFNCCSMDEKEKLIEYLKQIDIDSVSVDIQIDFSHTSVEELQQHDDIINLALASYNSIIYQK